MEIRGNKIITSQTFTTTDKTTDTITKVIVYEFLSKSGSGDDHGEQSIKIRVYDLGGHNEYTLINTICLTEKSLILLLFRSSNYLSHEDSFYQTIGCYLDMILSKTSDAAILLIAGRMDELQNDDFLIANDKKELENLFQLSKDHIEMRLVENKSSQRILRSPKLISWGESKVLELSNKYDDPDTITKSQDEIRSAIHSILLDENIIDFETKGNAPKFWSSFGAGLKDKFSDLNFCNLAEAKEYFNTFNPELVDTKDEEHIDNSEIEVIRLLALCLENAQNAPKPLPRNRKSKGSSDISPKNETEDNDIDIAKPPIMEKSPKDIEKTLSENEKQPLIENTEQLSKPNKMKRQIEDCMAALRFLKDVGKIYWFDEFEDTVFPCGDAVINTFRVLIDHKLSAKLRKYLQENKLASIQTTKLIGKGIISKELLDLSFQIEMEDKQNDDFVTLDKFKELLTYLGMSTQLPDDRLFVPSLINSPIVNFTKGRSPEEVYNDFKNQLRYVFVFGKGKSFASSGVIEALLVDFYTTLGGNSTEIEGANCYRERIERRIPGIVFATEVFFSDYVDTKFTIIEEEKINFQENSCVTTERILSIFVPPGLKTKEKLCQIHSSVSSVMKRVMKVEFNGLHGLQCFKCHKKGKEAFFQMDDPSKSCGQEHVLNNFNTACDGTSKEDKKLVIKSLAYAVSMFNEAFCRLFLNRI